MREAELQSEIEKRYTTESVSCANLSCGSNLSFINMKKNGILLDIGCGKGADTLAAAEAMPEGKAVGLDITDSMIIKAKELQQTKNVNNAGFIKGDIENLPFANEKFDYVVSNCVINHAKSKVRAYSEIRRVLKNGGCFVISDPVTRQPLPDKIKNDAKEWADCFGGALTEEEYISSIREAGFSKIDILNRREYVKKGYDFISLTIKAWR